jgi:serine/threonine-protein kinase
LVHRDLKPENLHVVRTPTGEERCKVLDFGSAKTDVAGLTATGAVIGTVRYMAPEQLCDASAASPLADIYALGSVLYECLCGEPPHSNVSLPDLMFAIMNEEPLRLETRCEAVPRLLADAVHCALSKSLQGRFSDASQLARALHPYVSSAKSTAEP